MPEDGGEGTEHLNELNFELVRFWKGGGELSESRDVNDRGIVTKADEVHGEKDRNESFKKIQEEAKDAGAFADNAEDIGGTNVSRARGAYIDSLGLCDEQAEGNRANQEGYDGKEPSHLKVRTCLFLFVENRIPLGEVLFLCGEESIGRATDLDAEDFVAFFDRVDDVLTFGHFTKDRVFSIQPWGGFVGDEELRAVGAGSGVGHGEDAGLGVCQRRNDFIAEFVSGTSCSCASWITALNHEVRDDAVEGEAVVISTLGEVEKVCGSHRSLTGKDCALDLSFVCFDDDRNVGDSWSLFLGFNRAATVGRSEKA